MTIEEDREEILGLQWRAAKLQLEHIANTEAHAAMERPLTLAYNRMLAEGSTPEAKREWQRHQVAVAAMSGILASKTLGWSDEVWSKIPKVCYNLAEFMMLEREKRAKWQK